MIRVVNGSAHRPVRDDRPGRPAADDDVIAGHFRPTLQRYAAFAMLPIVDRGLAQGKSSW
jgi:hypothetical protein